MIRLSNLSIYRKLILMMVLSNGVSLLTVGIVILFYDTINYTTLAVSDLKTQGEIIGSSSMAALSFDDPRTANEYLSRLAVKQSIAAAAIYRPDGSIFASYTRQGTPASFPRLAATSTRIEGDDAIYLHPMLQGNTTLGTVYLLANLGRTRRLQQFALMLGLATVFAWLIGGLASSRLQTLISKPLQQITHVAQAMIHRGDNPSDVYRERAIKSGNDEIGVLADAFNQMLNYMEKRDAALVEANRSLSAEVLQRERAQLQLAEKIDDLAQSNAELEQFAYVSSHDLQEPLRMVASYTQLLERRYRDKFDADGLEFLNYIVDGAKRMRQLIEDLLSLSRIGTQVKPMVAMSSTDALNTALTNLNLAITESAAEIIVDPLPRVLGDPAQLPQLFQNLIANAIVYRGKDAPHIHVSAKKQGSQWLFSVADNGIGIATEHSKRIFVIFQRLHGKGEYPGTGIGLAICKKIVERHGGRIWVESEEGKGSIFYFLLPGAA